MIALLITLALAVAPGAGSADMAKEARESPYKFLKLVGPHGGRPSYTKAGFGVVNLVSGKIVNSGPLSYKDATLRCEYRGESGTVLGVSEPKLYELFPAHSTKKLVRFNTGFMDPQSVGASCIIVDAQVVEGLK